MKKLFFFLLAIANFYLGHAQCTATIAADGPTYFCDGKNVNLSFSASNSWTQKAALSPISSAVAFSIGNKAYVGAGFTGTWYSTGFFEYDPITNVWTQKASYKVDILSPVGFSIGNKGYVGIGNYTQFPDFPGVAGNDEFWEYNPSTNIWVKKANFPDKRYSAVGFSIGNKGYIGTGYKEGGNNDTARRDFWEYDPSLDVWTKKADFGGGFRTYAKSFSIGNKGYIGLGYDAVNGNVVNDFWEYDPTTDVWTKKANFPTKTVNSQVAFNQVAFAIGSKGYISYSIWEGVVGQKDSTYFWEFNPLTNIWTKKLDFLGGGRLNYVGFSVGNRGYIGLGSKKSDIWEYNPNLTYAWSTGATSLTISASQAGNYTVTTRDTITGCIATSPPAVITIFSLPDTSITASGPTSFCNGGNVTITTKTNNKGYWLRKPDFLGTERQGAVAVYGKTDMFNNVSMAIIGTGNDGTNKKDFWRYNSYNDTWMQIADFGGTARSGATGFFINNAISVEQYFYVGTGNDGTNRKDFWRYSWYFNTWQQVADFGGTARSGAVGFSIAENGLVTKGYVGTGNDGNNNNDFWEYTPSPINTWTRKANFGGTARTNAIGFSINADGYIGTGNDGTNKNDFWKYNVSTNKWIQMANVGGFGRTKATGFVINNLAYIGLGVTNRGSTNDFWEYNPGTNLWLQKESFYGTPRYGAVGFAIGDKGYVTTGNDGANQNDLWEFGDSYTYKWSNGSTTPAITTNISGSYTLQLTTNHGCTLTSPTINVSNNSFPTAKIDTVGLTTFCQGGSTLLTVKNTGSWIRKTDLEIGPSYNVVFSIGAKAYMPGTNYLTNETTLWEYNTTTDSWSQKAGFIGTPRENAAGFSIGTNGYMGTGAINNVYFNDFWKYNSILNVWTRIADFGGVARSQAASFSIGNRGYVGAGFIPFVGGKDFWEYNPNTDVWTQKADVRGPLRYAAFSFSIGNKGFIGAGQAFTSAAPILNDFWEYNPTTNIWLQKADFSGAKRKAAWGFSAGNKGYICSGLDKNSNPINEFWEYESTTDKWTRKADFLTNEFVYGFPIIDRVFVAGGYSIASGNRKANFWEFEPNQKYLWSNGDTTASISVNTNGSYQVTVTNSSGCSSTSAPTVVAVSPPLTATITSVGNLSFCSGGGVLLKATIPTNSTMQWMRGSNNIAGAIGTSYYAQQTGSYKFKVTKGSCTNFSATKDVLVNALPSIANITGTKSICKGSTSQLSNVTAGGTWNSSDTAKAKVSTTGLFTGISSGTAVITYTTAPDVNGCTNKKSVTITVFDVPTVASITGITTLCSNKTTQLSNATTGGTWSCSNITKATVSSTGLVTGKNIGSPTITYATAANSNGCKSRVSVKITITAPCLIKENFARSLDEEEKIKPTALEVAISPNPTGNFFNVQVKAPKQESITIRVMDVNGKIHFSAKGMPEQVFHFGEQLISGTYLVEVRQGEEVKTVKAVKVRQ